MLYIVGTPIGNLKDISLRALETLKKVDGIICEDTRRSSILLNHYDIKKPLLVLNDFNESRQINTVLDKLQNGANIALISDAGMPLISDPGYKLIRETVRLSLPLDIIPGPTAATTALILSALPPDKFFFIGYLPEKTATRTKMLENLKEINNLIKTTFIIYVSPHKLIRTLEDIRAVVGDIKITLTAELTKINQQVRHREISQFLEEFKTKNPKGEYTLLLNLA